MTSFLELSGRDPGELGVDLLALMEELYPICRSITGQGTRQSLEILARTLPLEIHEVPTGTAVFDWTVPKEWNIRDAYVADGEGNRVIDFAASNLHVVNYSAPIRRKMSLAELKPHLHTLVDHPDWIPYKTSYYQENWGFCLRHRDYEALADGEYEVVIDSSLEDGHLSYGELFLPGKSEEEILLSTHICHPSMANDNLSGVAVLTAVSKALLEADRRYSYRILYIPGTIGSISWLARNQEGAGRIRHGVVLAGVGDRGPLTWKRSRRGDAEVDRAMIHILAHGGADHRTLDFSPYGYDERQFCSPGFDLPVGRFSRSEYGSYPEYHTSADDLRFISADCLDESHAVLMKLLLLLESNGTFLNTNPHCEPQLGKRGLYDHPEATAEIRMALLWVLNLADGEHSLLSIAERSQMDFESILGAARVLEAAGLIQRQS